MKNLEKHSVILEGKGKSKEEALGNALMGLQKSIKSGIKDIPIRIEPLEVQIIEGKELTYTERFMFFFMKREVKEYHIKIQVIVNLFTIDIESFNFEKVADTRFLR